MGCFGAVFGCRGDVGFSVPLLWVSRGDTGFSAPWLGARSGDGGFTVAACCALCAKKFALLGLVVCVSAKKFALRAQNGSKLAYSGVLGELFAEVPVEGLCWASFFAPVGPAPRSCR